MGYFYFPSADNIEPMPEELVYEIDLGLYNLCSAKLPWEYQDDISDLEFYVDNGMTTDNGIMGYTKFMSNKILLAPFVAQMLSWKWNNEMAMNVVIHELTHRRQMQWVGGLLWLFFNIPGISHISIEKWAKENGNAAQQYLAGIYQRFRNENRK